VSRNGFIDLAREFELTRRYAERLDLRASSLSQEAGTLSGGNQQKVVIGKWLATQPRVIILDEPTKGIDVGSKAAVHAFMGELVGQGLAVIMVSSEIPEILGMADRVIVMREGRIAGRFDRAGLTAEMLVSTATGNIAEEAA
jgi:rhamnose transport system ATP-binding protein